MFISLNEVHLIEKIYIITALITGLGSFFLGFFVFYKRKWADVNKSYLLMSLSVGIWSTLLFFCHVSSDINMALFLNRLLHLAAIFIPITFFHFTIIFLNKLKQNTKWLRLGYISSFILVSIIFTPLFIKAMEPKYLFRIWPLPGIIYSFFLLLFFIYFIYSWCLVYKSYRKETQNIIRKKQLLYLLIGLTIGLIGGSTNYAYFYNVPIHPIGNPFVLFYVVLYAVAIRKYRLMDIELIIARSFILFCVYVPIILISGILWSPWSKKLLHPMLGNRWYLIPFAFTAGMLSSGIFSFIYLHFQQKYDQKRLKHQRIQLEHLKEITNRAIEIHWELLLRRIPPFLMQMYRKYLGREIDYAAVYYKDKKIDKYVLFSYYYKSKKPQSLLKESLSNTDPIPSWFDQKAPELIRQNLLDGKYRKAFTYEDIDYYQSKQTNVSLIQSLEELKSFLKTLNAEACVFCYYQNRLLAFLVLGKKQRGSYSEEELDTFISVAGSVSMVLKDSERIAAIEQGKLDSIHSMVASLEERDSYTKGHSVRVAAYAKMIAEELILSGVLPYSKIFELLEKAELAGLLHDVGKIGVRDDILLKPEKLTESERNELEKHPLSSSHIVETINSISEEVKEGVKYHHERFDGTGYVAGEKGQRIPPIARILAVADAYDAMTSSRPYRKEPLSEEEAKQEINKKSGTQFDPDVVVAFNKAFEKGKLKKLP